MANYIGIFGIIAILGIAVAFSGNRKAINLRVVGAAFALQLSCTGAAARTQSRS
jgi:CNT family concentrative nucleoside transporter